MANSQKIGMEQRMTLRLSQQQLRYVKLLELNAPEMEEAVERELEENPALEGERQPRTVGEGVVATEITNAYKRNPEDVTDFTAFTPDSGESLYDYLRQELSQRDLPEDLLRVADYVAGSLDSNGYLRRTPASLADDLTFTEGIPTDEAEIQAALAVIRDLEPFGVGASSLQECLEIQLEHLHPSADRDNALRIIREEFREFSLRHDNKVRAHLKLTEEEVRRATSLIRSLNPKPGAGIGSSPADSGNVIVPDFIVGRDDEGELQISLNNNLPELRIDESFASAAREMKEHAAQRNKERNGESKRAFILNRYNDARDFIKIVQKRQQTMMDVMTAIVSLQREYFETEDVYALRTMKIKDVAARTGLDVSVISRATTNKHVATPWGVFPLRFFFSDSVSDSAKSAPEEGSEENSDVLTNRKIEAEIRRLVETEDKRKPLSDEKIRALMEDAGYDVSRRTVAKYRDRIGIPVARLRKETLSGDKGKTKK